MIALTCRNLPLKQRPHGIMLGTSGSIATCVALIGFAVTMLQVPKLKIVSSAMTFWTGIKQLAEDDMNGYGETPASVRRLSESKTIVVADFVMSLDKAIAIAGAPERAGGEQHMLPVVL